VERELRIFSLARRLALLALQALFRLGSKKVGIKIPRKIPKKSLSNLRYMLRAGKSQENRRKIAGKSQENRRKIAGKSQENHRKIAGKSQENRRGRISKICSI